MSAVGAGGRRRRRNRPTVIQHTSVQLLPITVDLCTTPPAFSQPSCIDLTHDADDDEVVDLTSVNDGSVVFLGTIPPEDHPPRRMRRRASERIRDRSPVDTHISIEDQSTSNGINVLRPRVRVKKFTLPKCDVDDESPAKKIVCPVCLDGERVINNTCRQLVSTVCGHIFCNSCIREAIRSQHSCPNCRKKLTMKQFHPVFL